MRYVLMCLFVISVLPGPCLAETKFALVIGNGKYTAIPELKNPRSDAVLISSALRQNGFAVTTVFDLDGKALRKAIRNFTSTLRSGGKGSVGFIYYAGHSLQVRENNYLLPVDADIQKESDAAIEAVHLNDVVNAMYDAENRMNLIVLDACRDNPFRSSLKIAASGLAGLDAPVGTLIAFLTAPGKVALDGTGDNSPYAAALARAFLDRPKPVEKAFKDAREQVFQVTRSVQTPWESSSLIGELIVAATGAKVASRSFIENRAVGSKTMTAQENGQSAVVVDSDGRLAYFVEWKYLGGESGATPLSSTAYADYVEYYSKGLITRADVMKDKAKYYQRWPNRRYKMARETLELIQAKDGFLNVYFEYTFDVESSTKRIQGRGNASLRLQRAGESFILHREAGDVVERRVTDKAQQLFGAPGSVPN